jgi:hypothetical protein
MTVRQPRHGKEEFARRGNEIYEAFFSTEPYNGDGFAGSLFES